MGGGNQNAELSGDTEHGTGEEIAFIFAIGSFEIALERRFSLVRKALSLEESGLGSVGRQTDTGDLRQFNGFVDDVLCVGPEGVIVETLQMPAGWTYEVKRADDRIVSIAWNVDVKPGEFIEVAFVARNPRQGAEIVWTLRQRFADGTVTDWTNGPNGVRPTARTALTPRPQ